MSNSICRPWSRVPALIAGAFAAAFGCNGSAPAFSPSCNDASTPPVPSTSPVCGKFARDTLFDAFIARDFGGSIGGMTGTSSADIYVALGNAFQGQVARWDGSVWAFETLPADAFSVSPLTIDAAGEPWAVIAERGNTLSGVGGPSALIHRRAGAWTLEPKPLSGDLGPLGGTSSGLFVGTADAAAGAFRLWGWQDSAWRESPVVPPRPESANRASFAAYGFWSAGCGEALAFGGGATTDTLVAGLFRLTGTSWVSVAVPPLSEIVAVSGPSLDELYVLALNRNQDGNSRIFHVTNGLQTWTLLPTPPTVDYTAVWSPGPSLAVAVGCEWPDKTVPRTADCARITTFLGDTLASVPLSGVEGDPVGLWREPQTGALHLLTAVADMNGLLKGQHFVAPAQCP